MEPIIFDADNDPTTATDETPPPPTLFPQWTHLLNPNWAGRREGCSPSSLECQTITLGTQFKDEMSRWQSESHADTTTWEGIVSLDDRVGRGEKGSIHFSIRPSLPQAHVLTCVPKQGS
jgi:hypothetical protein